MGAIKDHALPDPLFETLCDSIELGVIVIDKSLRIHHWNQWMALQTHVKSQDAQHQYLTNYYPCIKERGVITYINQTFETRTAHLLSPVFHKYFIPIPTQLQGYAHMRQYTRLIPAPDANQTPRIFILIEDYTERLYYENTLTAKNEELQKEHQKLVQAIEDLQKAQHKLIETEKLNTLLEIAGATAHEFSQPLSGVLGCLQLALTQTPETAPIYPLLEDATNAAKRMADLLHKIQSIKRYQTKPYLHDIRIVDLESSSRS